MNDKNITDIFSINETQIAKGIAILLMLFHHLFRFPERLMERNVSYIPLFQINSLNIEYIIGDFAKICVTIFVFITGYGIYLNLKQNVNIIKYILSRLFKFYTHYWLCFIIFVPIGLIYFSNQPEYTWNARKFISSFIGLSNIYNGPWWFVRVYVLLVIVSPLIVYCMKKNTVITLIVSGIIHLFGNELNVPYMGKYINIIFAYQFSFAVGCLFAKYKIYNLINNFLTDYKFKNIFVDVAAVLFLVILRITTNDMNIESTIDPIITPFYIYHSIGIVSKMRLRKLLIYLGNYSLYMWLVHAFFCYYFMSDFIFWPKYSIVVFVFLVIASLVTSVIIDNIYNLMKKYILKIKLR